MESVKQHTMTTAWPHTDTYGNSNNNNARKENERRRGWKREKKKRCPSARGTKRQDQAAREIYRHAMPCRAAPGWTPQTRLVKINNPLHIEESRKKRKKKEEREVTRKRMKKRWREMCWTFNHLLSTPWGKIRTVKRMNARTTHVETTDRKREINREIAPTKTPTKVSITILTRRHTSERSPAHQDHCHVFI